MVRAALVVLAFAAILVLGIRTTPASTGVALADDPPAAWPLRTGSAWIYRGLVRWPRSPEASAETVEQAITWRMEVLDVIERGHVRAAVMRGHPADVFGPQPFEAVPSDYLLVAVGAARFYEVRGDERVPQALARLRDPGDLLVDLVRDEDVVLDLPLVPGKRVCEAFQITRQDGGYCWVVHGAEPARLGDVVGVDPTGALTAYRLRKGAVNGDITIGFVAGVGIIRFSAFHRAVRWEADLRLVEYRPGER